MIRCPTCKHEEYLGAIFCSECGSQLNVEHITTKSLKRTTGSFAQRITSEIKKLEEILPQEAVSEAVITLHVIELDQFVPLQGKDTFTLGRRSPGQTTLPDVDLTPYNAYVQGVSRVHAKITMENGRVSIVDLGSVNGTRVNGNKLKPHVPRVLQHGDIIALGKLKIQIIIRRQ